MDSLYHSTNRSLQEAHTQLSLASHAQIQEFPSLFRELQVRLEQISSNCERLDILVNKEPITRRQNAKIRVDQLKYDVRNLQGALRTVAAKQAAKEEDLKRRDDLMRTQFTTNSAAASNGTASETSILIDRALEHNTALNRSHRGIDDMLSQGAQMLENLRDQRGTMKGIHKKMMDIASTLGMSNTVMGLVERRQQGDKYILIGGALFTCLVMYLVLKYFT
ncbi:hypothetical protein TCAL_10134 [Tigriopus californicus]|uniref:Golgi SNAP receptor complex member 2 n=1 Tax=Tigriopus californicus TaxID=6832 RepID=A0A553P1E7_TIGCA|nr:Golgi SNAP receptor complex member 2-like [Tigriopus californicus]TRY71505.1 hypothetical protein TCAL_10134 [Tigriopus californicus]|eukprot:TCALIF_10134-PA protein Name:"Similar to Gosr2 Golgi SNAP receptor complex member 2 (Mus musculus)" AED:0.10 eAED:0.10 QI:122/1/1/1/1/1/4/64/220